MPNPPKRTDQQRAAALAKAAEARRVRAEARRALSAGDVTLGDLLDRVGEDLIEGIKVKALLTAVPGLGKVKTQRLMAQLGISETRRLRGLTSRQKEALLAALS